MKYRRRNPSTKLDMNMIIMFGALWYAYRSGILTKLLADLRGQLPGGNNGGGGGDTTYSERMQQILAINPNAVVQMKEWINLRKANGEDPCDWYAMRAHYRGIGAPDPGDPAPSEFTTWCKQ